MVGLDLFPKEHSLRCVEETEAGWELMQSGGCFSKLVGMMTVGSRMAATRNGEKQIENSRNVEDSWYGMGTRELSLQR